MPASHSAQTVEQWRETHLLNVFPISFVSILIAIFTFTFTSYPLMGQSSP
jgi:hypothetical protein